MKLINKTEFNTVYLRKVIEWVRGQVGLRPTWMEQITFKPSRTRSWSYKFWHGSHRAVIMIKRGSNGDNLGWALGHVLGYMAQAQDKAPYARGPVKKKTAEIAAAFSQGVNMKLQARSMAQDDVDMLCAKAGVDGYDEANIQPVTKPKVSPVQKRARKAAKDLARWERKLKLAKGKVSKLQKRVAYYAKTVLKTDGCEGRSDATAGA